MRNIVLIMLVLLTSCGCPHKFIPSDTPEPLAPIKLPKKVRVALVLGSGGVRGMAHVGVIEELEKEGIPIDLIVGCSAGSIVGALYADNPNIADIKNAVAGINSDSIFNIDIWNCRFGLSQGASMLRVLNAELDAETFDQLKIPLVIVASDLHSGELVPIGSGDLVKSVQASCSIPFFFVPCDHMGRILVDGGVINPVPTEVAYDLGAEFIIAVDLSELLPKTFPTNLFGVATRSAEIAMMWQNEVSTQFADVVIRPRTCGIGTFNEKMKFAIYEAGKKAAQEEMPKIKELLEKHTISLENTDSEEDRQVTLECYGPRVCVEPI